MVHYHKYKTNNLKMFYLFPDSPLDQIESTLAFTDVIADLQANVQTQLPD